MTTSNNGTTQHNSSEWRPVEIGRLALQHRFVMSPMTRSRAAEDGAPGESAPEYYAQRAGLGLLISEGTQPSDDGQGYPWTPGIYTDAHVAGWRKVADAVHDAGGHLFIQLMHAGRYGHPDNTPHGRQLVAPSAIAPQAPIFTAKGLQQPPEPRALHTDEVAGVIDEFRHAARRAIEAGADGVEIHAAGGYLVHSFFGVNSNQRDDHYGGTVENRARFAVEVAQALADEIGADRVGIRFSPFNTFGDVDEGDEAVALYTHLAAELNRVGIAYIHVYDFGRDDILQGIRQAWDGPLLVVRDGREPDELTKDLESGLADVVPVGKLALANPDFVDRWRVGGPFNAPNPETMFGGDDRGYTDYPTLAG